MNTQVLSVSQLNRYVKSIMDSDPNLSGIYLRGEISNFTNHYKSGHLYFSLKDNAAAVKAVMFSSSAARLRFEPKDGMQVIVRGRACVYEATGQFQFYVDSMQPDGLGALSLQYEQLRDKLMKEGLFDESHKKPIPKYPYKIGVVTSPTGAAVRDIINVTKRRWPVAELIMYPVLVQGDGAAKSLTGAMHEINLKKACDVVIIGRGGGSLEDLFCFNDEGLAREIYKCEIPVISAVGHETDFTICDFVSDMRAPTPSAAAELATPDINEVLGQFSGFREKYSQLLLFRIQSERKRVDDILAFGKMKRPLDIVAEKKLYTDNLYMRFENAAEKKMESAKRELAVLCGKMDALSPFKVLSRGYAIAQKEGKAVSDISGIAPGDMLSLKLCGGSALCEVKNTATEEK